MPRKSPHAGTGTDAVAITTKPIAKPDPNDGCCNGEPSTLDVYANGKFHCTACRLCVDTVPGYSGGLKLDDAIPGTWEVLDANGAILLRVAASSAGQAAPIYDSWISSCPAPARAAIYRQATARTLFGL